MSNPDPRRYSYVEYDFDKMANCSVVGFTYRRATPDELIESIAGRIAYLGDGIPRLKRLIASLEVLRDYAERAKVAEVTKRLGQ